MTKYEKHKNIRNLDIGKRCIVCNKPLEIALYFCSEKHKEDFAMFRNRYIK